jgi:hypothetical protein
MFDSQLGVNMPNQLFRISTGEKNTVGRIGSAATVDKQKTRFIIGWPGFLLPTFRSV